MIFDPNRRTGRTTLALKAACGAAKAGGRVVYVVHAESFIWYAIDRCGEAGLLEGATVHHAEKQIRYLGGGEVSFVVADPRRGLHRGEQRVEIVHIDHHVYELEASKR